MNAVRKKRYECKGVAEHQALLEVYPNGWPNAPHILDEDGSYRKKLKWWWKIVYDYYYDAAIVAYKLNKIKNPPKPYYTSDPHLAKLRVHLNQYIPNFMPDVDAKTQKRRVRIDKVYTALKHHPEFDGDDYNPKLDMYDLQLRGLATINDIYVSHLLGCNDVVVAPLVGEYKRLKLILTLLTKEYKSLNQFPEIKEHIPVFTVKSLKTMLFNDLTLLSSEYDIECDIKALVSTI